MWRIRTNCEPVDIFGNENIISVFKSARPRWAGHVVRFKDDEVGKKIIENRVDGKRSREDGLVVVKVISYVYMEVIGKY